MKNSLDVLTSSYTELQRGLNKLSAKVSKGTVTYWFKIKKIFSALASISVLHNLLLSLLKVPKVKKQLFLTDFSGLCTFSFKMCRKRLKHLENFSLVIIS